MKLSHLKNAVLAGSLVLIMMPGAIAQQRLEAPLVIPGAKTVSQTSSTVTTSATVPAKTTVAHMGEFGSTTAPAVTFTTAAPSTASSNTALANDDFWGPSTVAPLPTPAASVAQVAEPVRVTRTEAKSQPVARAEPQISHAEPQPVVRRSEPQPIKRGGLTDEDRAEMVTRMRIAVEQVAAEYGNPTFAQIFTNDQVQAQVFRKRVQMLQRVEAIQQEIVILDKQKQQAKDELTATRRELTALQTQVESLTTRIQKARLALDFGN